ncbi:C40 family peptidase [Anaeromicropila herbilytica]|uniref:Uncharacterized protein n=1 Tax=Anaeromicropila herbilytica TaxID=2785025 RepID=A0A7R7ELS9_9FIRM|nr:SH3 domain-containing C40 family peptidase [Anaeromicropila herbilytica]BCN30935.1 hypothetical protein bsdtb5_22300 [Anaeromicropila herbilytica]
MRKNVYKLATLCVIGTLSIAGKSMVAKANEIPVAGIDVILDEYYSGRDDEEYKIEEYLNPEISEYQNLAIAQVSNYVNIRVKADDNSKILGKLYNNSAATILEEKGEWLKITSGTVTGYIKSEYVVTGDQIKSLAQKVGKRYAVINTTTLKVREKANLNSEVLTLVPIDEEFAVTKELDGWVKVSIDNDIKGYIALEYVTLRTEYKEAESIEEEKARLEKEKRKAEEIAREEAARNAIQSQSSSASVSRSNDSSSSSSSATTKRDTSNNQGSNSNSSSESELRRAIVQYALRFEGNPYVWGGTSLTNGADCSGFTQSIFRNYGISIPRTSRTQATGGKVISISQMQQGDLIFYDRNGTINHVGIYIGNGKVISASSPETGIRITNYNYREPNKVVSYID